MANTRTRPGGSDGAGDTPAAQLADLLYARVPPDVLAGLSPTWLVADAQAAARFIAHKPKGRHKIGVRSAPAAGDTPGTIVEILNDDMPFLVDSALAEVQARGLAVELLLHPIFRTTRSPDGELRAAAAVDAGGATGQAESYIAILVRPLSDAEAANLVAALDTILQEVRLAVSDWSAMRQRVVAAIADLSRAPAAIAPEERSESTAFLDWLEQGNFVFLGLREYALAGTPETGNLLPVAASGLGILRNAGIEVLRRGSELVAMTPEIRRFFFERAPLIITKANVVSRVHRRVHMDYVGVKTYGSDGATTGELRIVGLFTSQAYIEPPTSIPFLRHKAAQVLAAAGYPAHSHAAKALANILATFPRDELFQIGVERLTAWTEGILDLETRPRVRAFVRVDRFDRFVSALIYVPRERYSSQLRERIGALLSVRYEGRIVAFYPYFPLEGPLVRVQFIVGRFAGPTPAIDTDELEREIAALVRTWTDRLLDLIAATGDRASGLAAKYAEAFSAGYAETFTPERAMEDIERIERLGPSLPVAVDFYRETEAPAHRIHAAIYRFGPPISLSERVPVLENFGFTAVDERSYVVTPRLASDSATVTLHDMVLESVDTQPVALAQHDRRLEAAFLAVFGNAAENDGFNRLVMSAELDWRQVAVLRAYGAYLRQLGTLFSLRFMSDALHRHAGIAGDLVALFTARFDPDRPEATRGAEQSRLQAGIEQALQSVPTLDDDYILRQYLNLVLATVRTNVFQRDHDGAPPATIAFKFDSKAVTASPEPRPFREIWLASPRVEGIHLRFAPIARGGIRWSDRAQDFRTEVLGLVRAQLVKNAVIVPSGAKGGFLPKRLPRAGSRDEIQAEGIAAYRIFIRTLLSITDNIQAGRIVPPPRVVRHDGDDAYLVVAADKGTATFSDIANDISAEAGFWLGDAFASGGSAGYDHKKMAITARGAWECVKRHFRELDIDIQSQRFTCVGVGDMSGDVFGNGLLLSRTTRLVAAFDHRDIFIDPSPDPAASWAERKRLFDLPRSSWADYNRALLSPGGGIFSRSAKSIPLTAEIRALLDLAGDTVTPIDLIRAILKARVDLLFFGGIGTYVRAATETDQDVGDKANDALRITGADLRVRVVGEGANLGMTQRGRVEFAERGGRLNTDFIDNSAGVNTSDQEVNIKIALGPAQRSGRLDIARRNVLLTRMTDAVAAGSLRNNYQQGLALSLAARTAAANAPDLGLLMRALETRKLLVRKLEALPSDAALAERARAGRGLTRPELAVLLSYAKIALSHDLLASGLPDEPLAQGWLTAYFAPELRQDFASDIEAHSLRREIVATGITNAVVNRGGPAFAVRIADETQRTPADVAKAFLAVREIFDLPQLWAQLDTLDNRITGSLHLDLYQATQALLAVLVPWYLRDGEVLSDYDGTCARHRDGLAALRAALPEVLPPEHVARQEGLVARLVDGNVPPEIARAISSLDVLAIAPAVTALSLRANSTVAATAKTYLEVSQRLRIAEISAQAARIPALDYYDRVAITQAIETLTRAQAEVVERTLRGGAAGSGLQDIGAAERMLAEISADGALTVSRLVVAAHQLAAATQARTLTGPDRAGDAKPTDRKRAT